MTAPREIKDRVVLVTGASSGIGRALAVRLAESGALLALAARRVARLEELSRELNDRYGAVPLVLPTDVSKPEEIRSMVKKTYDHFGRIDVLVNNAAILKMEPFLTMPLEDMRQMVDTNFWSVVHAVREAAPIMGRAGRGHIVNVSSGAGRRGLPFMAVYTATKFALTGLSESLRVEMTPYKLDWTTVTLGGIDTDMPRNVDRRRLPPGYPDHSRVRISADRVARAILRAIERPRAEIFVPWYIRPGLLFASACPGLADFILRKAQRLK